MLSATHPALAQVGCPEPLYQHVRDPLSNQTALVSCCGCSTASQQIAALNAEIVSLQNRLADCGVSPADDFCDALRDCSVLGEKYFRMVCKSKLKCPSPFAQFYCSDL